MWPTFTFGEKFKRFLGGAILSSLLFGFLCISFINILPTHAMTMADMGLMSSHIDHGDHKSALNNCCDTSINDHMELWKNTFVGIPQSLEQLLTLVVVLFATLTFSDFISPSRRRINFIFRRFLQYARAHPNISTYNPLRLAFSQGILHPKTF